MSYIDVFKRIGGVAHDMVSRLDQSSMPLLTATRSLAPSISVDSPFPLPESILPSLMAIGLDRASAEQLSHLYIKISSVFRDQCEAEYARTCSALISSSDNHGSDTGRLRAQLRSVLISRYRQTLERHADMARKKATIKLRVMSHRRIFTPKDSPELFNLTEKTNQTSPVISKEIFPFKSQLQRQVEITSLSPIALDPPISKYSDSPELIDDTFPILKPSYVFPAAYPPIITPSICRHFSVLPPRSHVPKIRKEQDPVDHEIQHCIVLFSQMAISGKRAAKNSSTRLPPAEVGNPTRASRSIHMPLDRMPGRSPTPRSPSHYKFASKITMLNPQLAPPLLDTSPTVARYRNGSPHSVSSTANIDVSGAPPHFTNGERDKTTLSSPHRKQFLSVPYHVPSDVSVKFPRIPSLTFESSCESTTTSPFLGPSTPPSLGYEIPLLPDELSSSDGFYPKSNMDVMFSGARFNPPLDVVVQEDRG